MKLAPPVIPTSLKGGSRIVTRVETVAKALLTGRPFVKCSVGSWLTSFLRRRRATPRFHLLSWRCGDDLAGRSARSSRRECRTSFTSRPLTFLRVQSFTAHNYASLVMSKGGISVSNFETRRGMLICSQRLRKNWYVGVALTSSSRRARLPR